MSLGEQSSTDTLGELQGKGDKFTRLSLIEKKRQTDLQEAINYIMNETDKYRHKAKKSAIDVMNIHVLTPNPAYSRADGVNIGKEAQMVTTKTLHILEAKLNTLLQRKSEIQNHVKKMKETINHYRLLRMQTDAAHARFEQTLADTKVNIEGHLSEATKVMEDRDKVLEKKDVLERINTEEQQKFMEEYEEMGRFIKLQNDALEDALLQERKADRQGTTLAKTAQTEDGNIVSDLSLEEEIEMAKKVGSLTTFMQNEQSSLSDLREKIASYESMFEQLKKMTGVESLEDMVSSYIDHEEEMFSLYNFIQAMNAEIDNVKEGTLETEEAIVKFREDQQDQDQQRRSVIDELQQRLTGTLEITRQLVEDNAVQQESISQISKKVSSVFFKLQCDQMDAKGSNVSSRRLSGGARPDSKIALLTSQGVTESNVLDYLGCIEQRAVDIITEYLYLLNSRGDLNNGIITTLPGLTNAGNAYRINSLTGGGARSPTPGPPTPMTRKERSSNNLGITLANLDELADEDFFVSVDNNNNNNNNNDHGSPNMLSNTFNTGATSLTHHSTSNNNTHANNTNANTPNVSNLVIDNDFKLVDLKAFKSKLQKKLGLKDTKEGNHNVTFNNSFTSLNSSQASARKK